MLLRELTNPVFTHIALGAGHTYSHLRSPPPTHNTRSADRGRAVGAAHLRIPCSSVKTFFVISFLEINLKNYEKTDGSGVLAGIPWTF